MTHTIYVGKRYQRGFGTYLGRRNQKGYGWFGSLVKVGKAAVRAAAPVVKRAARQAIKRAAPIARQAAKKAVPIAKKVVKNVAQKALEEGIKAGVELASGSNRKPKQIIREAATKVKAKAQSEVRTAVKRAAPGPPPAAKKRKVAPKKKTKKRRRPIF